MSTPMLAEPNWRDALTSSVAALRRVSRYTLDPALDPALDQRILELAERKEFLTPAERSELLAWVSFTQQRTLEKLEAKRALRSLVSICPELGDGS
jgi:uncharacterized protein YbjT (DUF2867 family)